MSGTVLLAHVPTLAPSANVEIAGPTVAGLFLVVAFLIVATIVAGRAGLLPKAAFPFRVWTAAVAAALSLGAAGIHFAVIGEHLAEYVPFGVAFAALAWFQAGWALSYLVGRSRPMAAAAVLVNAGALVVWAVSRVVGLPIGAEPGEVEPVGALDLVAGALELMLIALLAWDLAGRGIRFRPVLPGAGATVVVGSSAMAVILLTTLAFGATGGDHGAAHEEATPSPSADSSGGPGETFEAGVVRFASSLDLAGEIESPVTRFRAGDPAVWIAEFSEPPGVSTIRLEIVQILPDGREFEHWRQEIPVGDPDGRRLVAGADLWIYVHGGEGDYRMRYLRGDELLAEGAFELVP